MRRLAFAAATAALLCLGVASRPMAQGRPALARENRILAAELELAQQPRSYFLFDLPGRRIQLRIRGMTLRELPVRGLGVWGPPLAPVVLALEHKDSLVRPAIRPGQEKTQETLDEQILELKDMPADYRLGLEGAVQIHVLSPAEGFWPTLRQRALFWRWWLTQPLRTLREERDHSPTTAIYLVLAKQDAQALYWAFYEGSPALLITP